MCRHQSVHILQFLQHQRQHQLQLKCKSAQLVVSSLTNAVCTSGLHTGEWSLMLMMEMLVKAKSKLLHRDQQHVYHLAIVSVFYVSDCCKVII